MKLFDRLVKENAAVWDSYLHHDFVKQLEKGVLGQENFLFYLKQDYIYLINYAKCYALLANNATTARELRFAMKFQNYIVEGELELHKSILQLGINADALGVKDESLVNIAYTRYMQSVASGGDFIDMLVALSSCAIGYGYIGREIYARLGEKGLKNHPYESWIRTYAGTAFQAEIQEFEDFVNDYTKAISELKFTHLSEIFHTVTRLECNFWQHGLEMKINL